MRDRVNYLAGDKILLNAICPRNHRRATLRGLVGLGDQMVCLLCMPWPEVIEENANQNIPSGHYWSGNQC